MAHGIDIVITTISLEPTIDDIMAEHLVEIGGLSLVSPSCISPQFYRGLMRSSLVFAFCACGGIVTRQAAILGHSPHVFHLESMEKAMERLGPAIPEIIEWNDIPRGVLAR